MNDTPNMSLPLLQPSQAQKHVTVNEALLRLDGLVQLVLQSVSVVTPPTPAKDGFCYGIGSGALGEWTGRDGEIAMSDNGGWVFCVPQAGWRAWDAAMARPLVHDGEDWRLDDTLSRGASGAGTRFATDEIEHEIEPGTSNTTALIIPAGVTVFSAGARVIDTIGGTAATWRLGILGATDRFGAGLGLGADSFADGVLGQPQGNYTPAALLITGEGGDLLGGRVRLAVHYMVFDLPGYT